MMRKDWITVYHLIEFRVYFNVSHMYIYWLYDFFAVGQFAVKNGKKANVT